MTEAEQLINQQITDYGALLAATRDLDCSDEGRVSAFITQRQACNQRTAERDLRLAGVAVDAKAPSSLVTRYRALLEQLVAAERELAITAGRERDERFRHLTDLGLGRQALSGYRANSGSGPARAITRRV